ncbi:unnamed protein product, partial [Nesidiocoris tenuis]
LHIRPIFKTTDRTESTYASVQVAEQISAVRLERHVLNSSDPLLEGGRARPGQLRLSGEKPSPGTAVYFTLSCRTVEPGDSKKKVSDRYIEFVGPWNYQYQSILSPVSHVRCRVIIEGRSFTSKTSY